LTAVDASKCVCGQGSTGGGDHTALPQISYLDLEREIGRGRG